MGPRRGGFFGTLAAGATLKVQRATDGLSHHGYCAIFCEAFSSFGLLFADVVQW